MKQYVQTDLEADRQVANTLAALILGGTLISAEVTGDVDPAGSPDGGEPGETASLPATFTDPFTSGKQKAPSRS